MWLASTVRSAISADFTSMVSTAAVDRAAGFARSFLGVRRGFGRRRLFARLALSSALSAAAAALSALTSASFFDAGRGVRAGRQ